MVDDNISPGDARRLAIEGMVKDGVLSKEQADILLQINEDIDPEEGSMSPNIIVQDEEIDFSTVPAFLDRKGNPVHPETVEDLRGKISSFFHGFQKPKHGVIRPSQYASPQTIPGPGVRIVLLENGMTFAFSEAVNFVTLTPDQCLAIAEAIRKEYGNRE